MTRMFGAVVLGSQVMVLIFAAVAGRAVTLVQNPEQAQLAFGVGLGLAALALVGAIAMRSRAGGWIGWAVQLGTLLYGLVVPMMVLVGLIFGALWIVALRKGAQMDALTDAHVAAQGG